MEKSQVNGNAGGTRVVVCTGSSGAVVLQGGSVVGSATVEVRAQHGKEWRMGTQAVVSPWLSLPPCLRLPYTGKSVRCGGVWGNGGGVEVVEGVGLYRL